MKKFLMGFAFLAAAGLAGSAFAAQCALITFGQARAAHALLKKGVRYATFCKPCGDKKPQGPYVVTTVTSKVPQKGLKEISLNGNPVDLAYLFVEGKPGIYRNAAKLTGCPAKDVPAWILVKGSPVPAQLSK